MSVALSSASPKDRRSVGATWKWINGAKRGAEGGAGVRTLPWTARVSPLFSLTWVHPRVRVLLAFSVTCEGRVSLVLRLWISDWRPRLATTSLQRGEVPLGCFLRHY
jgi:hypothetical protein